MTALIVKQTLMTTRMITAPNPMKYITESWMWYYELFKTKSERLCQDSVSIYTQATVDDPPNLAKKWKKQYAYLEMNDSFNCETGIDDDKDDNST